MSMSDRGVSRGMPARTFVLATVVGLSVSWSAKPSAAQAPPPPGWFVATPYGWMAGIGGQVGIRNLLTNIDVDFGDVVRHLRFAGMAAFDARRDPLVMNADVVYVSLGGSKAFAIRGASGDVTFDLREAIVQGVVGYTPLNTRLLTVDVLVGARYWDLSTEIGLDPANRDSRARSGSVDWVDATGGARVRFNAANNVHLVADGDVGGGGSRNTWRAMGTATYDLSRRYGLMAGYKYLSVDYDRNDFLFDTHTNGFLVGVTFTF